MSGKELYDGYVDLVRAGCLPFEANAREIAKCQSLSLAPLEQALGEAFSRLMKTYLTEIERGNTSYAERAYELAKERNFPSDRIDNALLYATRPEIPLL